MKWFSAGQSPIRIYGLAVIDPVAGRYWRLPQAMLDKMPHYDYLGKRAVGGRVRFSTDAPAITVRLKLAESREDVNIPLSGSSGADIYYGTGPDSVYGGYIAPNYYSRFPVTVEKTFRKDAQPATVTINLPRNDHVLDIAVGIDDGAIIEEPPEYAIPDPIVYYGSSITEGGCASRAGNAYASIVSRWLDADYRNYGFSGSAKGESEFAEFIASHERMSAFVYDYDHNAPTPEHLRKTHEAFFRIVRRMHPDLPVIFLSRPDANIGIEEIGERKSIIRGTFENARDAGDSHVHFLDGQTFFKSYGREECTVDGCHPNALGFMRMAEDIYALMRKILDQVSTDARESEGACPRRPVQVP